MTAVVGSLVNLNNAPYYLHWGFIRLSVGNLVVIVLMAIVFVAALLIPFPKGKGRRAGRSRGPPGPPPRSRRVAA